MLVLARQEGDGVTFPDLSIEVEILKIHGNRVQLGVHASRDITVLRSELVEEPTIQEANSSAASTRVISLRNKIREVAVQLAVARAQLERGDVDAAEGTLRSMRPLDTTKTVAASHVSEPAVAYHTSDRRMPRGAVRSGNPLHASTIQGAEGLAC
ncbi:MAG: carbon storage regulator [Pirellula sp.]|jgi:carbon storage regulator CsrA|nr:carbon storage regulator [Pirellula sp.]